MGKAIITSVSTGGLYSVDEVYENTWGANMRIQLENETATLSSTKATKGITLSNLQVAMDTLQLTLTDAITNNKNTKEITQSIDILKVDIFRLTKEINIVQSNINSNNIRIPLLGYETEVKVSTIGWSADFKEDIAIGTEVGIIDRKRTDQLHNYVTIQPTFRAGSTTGYLWDSDRDGVLQLKEGSPSSGWGYNYAMADGADTWIPRYVYASIHTIDHDTNSCTFVIDDFFANSISPHGKNISLPISGTFEYMACDSLSFIVTDSVVVDVSVEDNYKVIGFQTNPTECSFVTVSQVECSIFAGINDDAQTKNISGGWSVNESGFISATNNQDACGLTNTERLNKIGFVSGSYTSFPLIGRLHNSGTFENTDIHNIKGIRANSPPVSLSGFYVQGDVGELGVRFQSLKPIGTGVYLNQFTGCTPIVGTENKVVSNFLKFDEFINTNIIWEDLKVFDFNDSSKLYFNSSTGETAKVKSGTCIVFNNRLFCDIAIID